MLPFHIRPRKEPLTNSNSQVPRLTFTGRLGEGEGEGREGEGKGEGEGVRRVRTCLLAWSIWG